jgi:ribosomal protein L37AE/L43A
MDVDELPRDRYVHVCPECDALTVLRTQTRRWHERVCTRCGTELDGMEFTTGGTPEQHAEAIRRIKKEQAYAWLNPQTQLVTSLRRYLKGLTHYEIVRMSPSATTRELNKLLARPWEYVANRDDNGRYTMGEDALYESSYRESVDILSSPRRRADYDRTIFTEAELKLEVAGSPFEVSFFRFILGLFGVTWLVVGLADGEIRMFISGSVLTLLIAGLYYAQLPEVLMVEVITLYRSAGRSDTLPRIVLDGAFVGLSLGALVILLLDECRLTGVPPPSPVRGEGRRGDVPENARSEQTSAASNAVAQPLRLRRRARRCRPARQGVVTAAGLRRHDGTGSRGAVRESQEGTQGVTHRPKARCAAAACAVHAPQPHDLSGGAPS